MLEQRGIAVAIMVVGLRVAAPLFLPRFPLPAVLTALAIDAVDQSVFQAFTTVPLGGYQAYDKALDVYYLTLAYLATLRSWTSLDAFAVGQFLFFYRLVGVTLFELSGLRWLLLVFANTFEYAFIAYEAVRTRWDPRRLSRRAILGATAAIWVAIKLPQEWFIHVARLDFTDLLKRALGFPIDAGWSTVLAGRAGLLLAAVALAVVLAAVAGSTVRRLAPPPDWRFTVDGDGRPSDVTKAEARTAARARAGALVDRELVTKVVLVALVSVIFAQILPGVRATDAQLAMGVTFVVVVNTGFSESLIRRGFSWGSSLLEFVAMGAVNLIAAVGFELFFPVDLGSIDLGHTTFFVLLLTLIVTLYDHYRPYHLARVERDRGTANARSGAASATVRRA